LKICRIFGRIKEINMPGSFAKKFIKFHGFSILCSMCILILCTIKLPDQDQVSLFPNFDKFVHFMMYFSLSTILILETIGLKNFSIKGFLRACLIAIITTLILGGLIEIIQSDFTSYRSGDIIDWLSDMGGSVSACLVTGLIRLAFR